MGDGLPVEAVWAFVGIGWLFLIGFGIVYGILIYLRPFPPHLTSCSVVIGVTVTEIITSVIILVILLYFRLFHLWWLPLIPFAAYVTTGVPQIIVEWRKRKDQERANEALEKAMAENGL